MADAKQCVDFVLKQEDSVLAGTVTNEARDKGGLTRFGLTARFHPMLLNLGFYDVDEVHTEEALQIAQETYLADYAGPLHLAGIEDQRIANALLSFAVNEGNHEAITLLQKAAIACGQKLAPDGIFGLATLEAVNACQPHQLLNLYCLFEETFYRNLVQANASQQKFLKGWLNRINANRQNDVVST